MKSSRIIFGPASEMLIRDLCEIETRIDYIENDSLESN